MFMNVAKKLAKKLKTYPSSFSTSSANWTEEGLANDSRIQTAVISCNASSKNPNFWYAFERR